MDVRGIAAVASAQPERVALICDDAHITYGRLDADINRMARALHGAGAGHSDHVAVRLHNRPELFVVWNAAARLGAVVVPISYRLTADEVGYIVRDSGAVVFIHDDDDGTVISAAGLNQLRAVLHVEDPALWVQPPTPPTLDFIGNSVAWMQYTSGTTGRPKGIRRGVPVPTEKAPAWPVADFWGFGSGDVHLLCGPAYHTAPGAYSQMHLVEGARVVIMRRFDATVCLDLIARHGVTNSHMVPANFIRILEVDWHGCDLSTVRKILHAAAPCPPAVKRQIMEVFPRDTVWEYYGASEGMATVISPGEWLEKPGSVGRAFPGVTVRIVGEDGNELPCGEIGTIYISPRLGHGFEYHNAPEKTMQAWRDSMFTVGDLGWMDEDGYLFIADRRVDLIISGGVNIYPAEIERQLAEHPDVVDSAVFGLPDARMGQRVHAVVEVRGDAARDAAALLTHLGRGLADYKLPRSIEFVDELPREPNGKVFKQRLRDARLDAGGT